MTALACALAYAATLALVGWVLHLRHVEGGAETVERLALLERRLEDAETLSARTDAKVNAFGTTAKALTDTVETVSLLSLRAGLRQPTKPQG